MNSSHSGTLLFWLFTDIVQKTPSSHMMQLIEFFFNWHQSSINMLKNLFSDFFLHDLLIMSFILKITFHMFYSFLICN